MKTQMPTFYDSGRYKAGTVVPNPAAVVEVTTSQIDGSAWEKVIELNARRDRDVFGETFGADARRQLAR